MERFVQSKYTSQFPTHTIWMCQFNSDSIHLHSKSQSPKENWKYGFLWNILWPIKYKENPVAKRNPAKLASKNKGKVKWDTIWPGHTHTHSQLWHSCSSYHVMPCQWIYFKAFIIQTDIANSVSIQFSSIQFIHCKISMQRVTHFFNRLKIGIGMQISIDFVSVTTKVKNLKWICAGKKRKWR